jgi:hypothetical protein
VQRLHIIIRVFGGLEVYGDTLTRSLRLFTSSL